MAVEDLNGIVLIDKPAGWTSFDVVAKVRRIVSDQQRHLHEGRGFCIESQSAERASSTAKYGERATEPSDKAMASKAAQSNGFASSWRCRCKVRVGHAGTLDPFATGLLILMIGKATKQADQFLKLDKTYEATLRLGATSTTADPEGEITVLQGKKPSVEEINTILKKFVGTIQQTPPIFSAIKVNGRRAYDLARKGQEVVMQPREVTIHDISDVKYVYPTLSFTVKVSSGTYIRSLAVDIGESLGVGAYLTALRRTEIANYSLESAILPDKLNPETIYNNLTKS